MSEDGEPSQSDGAGYWRVLRDLVLLAALGVVAYVGLALLDPRGILASVVAALGPSSMEAAVASLMVVALAVAFLTWRRSLEVIREVEQRQGDRNRLENLARIPRLHPDPIVVVDLDGGITFLNQAAEEAFEDLPEVGLVHPVFEPLREHVGGGTDIDRERVIETELEHEGRTYEVKAWFDTSQGSARVYLHDVTEHQDMQEALRESREKLQQVTDHINEVFWITDPGRDEMIYVSPGYEEVWGRSVESLYEDPESWLEAVHPEDRPRIREAVEGQAAGSYDEEYRTVRPDGEVRWIRDRAFPVEDDDGNVERLVGVAADVTRERQAYDQLEDALHREQLLVDVIGHDVNNLLTRAIPRLDLLERQHDGIQDDVASVREPLERATDVLEQALLLLRIDLDEVDAGDRQRLGGLVRDVLDGLDRTAEEEGVELRSSNALPRDPLVDPLLARALENLVRNALEWGPEGEPVDVRVEEGDDGRVEVRVVDRGPGIPEETREKVFQRFERADEDGRIVEEDGFGLGLPIAHRIVRSMGGELRYEETPGGGATFVVTLPADREAPTGTPAPRGRGEPALGGS